MKDFDFFAQLHITNAIRRDWTTNHHLCPARIDSGKHDVDDKCESELNSSGLCNRKACPILWE